MPWSAWPRSAGTYASSLVDGDFERRNWVSTSSPSLSVRRGLIFSNGSSTKTPQNPRIHIHTELPKSWPGQREVEMWMCCRTRSSAELCLIFPQFFFSVRCLSFPFNSEVLGFDSLLVHILAPEARFTWDRNNVQIVQKTPIPSTLQQA
ncbi:hypothetical protein NHX12_004681 [Muraenolepis orangiensis]|uniref:Uncharacterized protein n=1 Tax=Muraenolepis orangiensis TaxID=630683 RepID=A0A9Q0ICH3_9TELE|nr:hypothetical protein NHX12_004681 [Muraenolepis orangiensis]